MNDALFKSKAMSVAITVRKRLCISCGICIAVCPNKAINWQYKDGQHMPFILDRCDSCGLCYQVCPGICLDLDLFGSNAKAGTPYIALTQLVAGQSMAAYVGHTNNLSIRHNGASGGLVTQLLLNALSADFKQCFVVGPVSSVKGQLEAVATDQMDFIKNAAGSKYLPVSIEPVARYLCEDRKERAVIVGTPCQIYGLRRLAKLRKIDLSTIIFLGLFCDRTMSHNFLQFIEHRFGCGANLNCFKYRTKESGGWPGQMAMQFRKNWQILPRYIRLALKEAFTLKRCLLCFDKFNILSDIAFGDCYLRNEKSELGVSNIIVRTKKGNSFLHKCDNDLVLKPVSANSILESQRNTESMARFVAGTSIHATGEAIVALPDMNELAPSITAVNRNIELIKRVRDNSRLPVAILRRTRVKRIILLPRVIISKIIRFLKRRYLWRLSY